MQRRDATTTVLRLATVALAAAGAACGPSDRGVLIIDPLSAFPPTPAPPQTIPPRPPDLVFSSLRPGDVVFTDITLEGPGKIFVTVDWMYSWSNIRLRLTQVRCDDPTDTRGACATLGLGGTSKPELMVVSGPPGARRLWITNHGRETETVSVRVVGPLP